MKNKWLYIVASLIVFIYVLWSVLEFDPFQKSIASKILRFHVLANSDSVEDQTLKLEVRNAVGAYLQPLLEDAEDLEDTKQIVNAHKEEIIQLAEQTLQKKGCYDKVSACITETEFPEKTYGSYTFPKGNYEALQITIGSGQGQNWWCVLYPNMCFRGTVYEVIEKDAQKALREVLSPWEYADVFDSPKVEVCIKLLEYFKD